MSAIQEQIEQLNKVAEEQQKKLQRMQLFFAIGYGLVVLVVLIYTLTIVPMIQKEASADLLAETIAGRINEQLMNLPEYRDEVRAEYQARREELAVQAVDAVQNTLLPPDPDAQPGLVEMRLTSLIDEGTAAMVTKVEHELVPELTRQITSQAPELREKYRDMTDDEATKGLVLVFMDVINTELDKYLNDEFIEASNELQRRLHQLAKADAQRNLKEERKRELLQVWWHLNQRPTPEDGDGIFKGLGDDLFGRIKLDWSVQELLDNLHKPLVEDD